MAHHQHQWHGSLYTLLVAVVAAALCVGCAGESECDADAHQQAEWPVSFGPWTQTPDGAWHSTVTSAYQAGPLDLTVSLPVSFGVDGAQLRFIYVFRVEAGVGVTFGDPVAESLALNFPGAQNMADAYSAIVVIPSFSIIPWYGDHASSATVQQEAFILNEIIPGIEAIYPPTLAHPGPPRRMCIGFSKSGNGSLSLILRNPTVFDAVAAWDDPLNSPLMSRWTNQGSDAVFGTQDNYALYAMPTIVASKAAPFTTGSARIYLERNPGSSFAAEMASQETTTWIPSGIVHTYVNGPSRAHTWGSGWLPGAAAFVDSAAPAKIAHYRWYSLGSAIPRQY